MQTTIFQNEIDLSEDAILKLKPDSPTKRLLSFGADSLSNSDLLCLILKPSKRDISLIAPKILEHSGSSINNLAKLSPQDLMRIKGVTEAQACALVASFALNRRRCLETAVRNKIVSSRQAFEILKPLIGDSIYEEFYIILLNRANFVLGYKRISEGGITGTVVDIRRIFKIAFENNATSLIIAHSHPSGNQSPSEADKSLTRSIMNAGLTLDIPVRDHLIVTTSAYFSFADEGLI